MFKAKIRLFLKLLYTRATVQFSMKLDHKLLGVEMIFFKIFEKNKILPKNISICIQTMLQMKPIYLVI